MVFASFFVEMASNSEQHINNVKLIYGRPTWQFPAPLAQTMPTYVSFIAYSSIGTTLNILEVTAILVV